MLQLIGAVLLLCASATFGFLAVQGLKERVKQLHFLITALEEMERELHCRLTPMPELLAALEARIPGPVGAFFSLCVSGLHNLGGRPFSKVWSEALEAADLHLEEGDRILVEELGSCLGRYDGQRQCDSIVQTRMRLEEHLADAAEQRNRLGRVYGTLSLAAGAFLVIVLI